MKTLKSIRLINFQSHKNALINFAEQGCLTVITGPSDSGKSAVIRALRWVFYNVPQGDGFIFNAEDKCSVLLSYEDGTTVERIRSRGGINRYLVNKKVYEGFGTSVPLEVQQATGIRKLEIGDQNFLLNLSEQLDGPFLGKSVSGPSRAKVLGKLAGTEEIDYANKQVGTDITRAKKQKEIFEKDIEGLNKQIGRYGFIHSWERITAQADAVLTDTKAKVAEIGNLKALMQQWMELNGKALALTMVVRGLQDVDTGLDLIQTACEYLAKGNLLATMRGSHLEALLESESARSKLIKLDPVFRYASPMFEEMTQQHTKSSMCADLYDRYDASYLSTLVLKKSMQRLSIIESVADHLRQAFDDNDQSSKFKDLDDQYERSSLLTLSLQGMVRSLSEIEYASDHLSKVSIDKSLKTSISDLANHYEGISQSFLIQSRVITRLLDIEKVNDHLRQAFKDNLQQGRVRETGERRTFLAEKITQSLRSFGELAQEISVAESDYLNLMLTLGKCPTCGNDIDVQKLKEVI